MSVKPPAGPNCQLGMLNLRQRYERLCFTSAGKLCILVVTGLLLVD